MSELKCPDCNINLQYAKVSMWNEKLSFQIPYCPKCKYTPKFDSEQVSVFKGKALRGIDKRNGQFRMKVIEPEDFNQDIIVETYPDMVITKPAEWKYSKRRGLYKTKGRASKVYPEVTRGDEIIVSGVQIETHPLFPLLLHNSTVGISYQFVADTITTKVGLFSKIDISNPFLDIAREKMSRYID